MNECPIKNEFAIQDKSDFDRKPFQMLTKNKEFLNAKFVAEYVYH